MAANEKEGLADRFLCSAQTLMKALQAMRIEVANSEYLEKVARRAAATDSYVIFPLKVTNQNGGFSLCFERNREPPRIILSMTKGAVDITKLEETFIQFSGNAPDITVQFREADQDEARTKP